MEFLHIVYSRFDDILTAYDVYKVETIGDSYMVITNQFEFTQLFIGGGGGRGRICFENYRNAVSCERIIKLINCISRNS